MKKTQLKQIIKEEINKIFNEITVKNPSSMPYDVAIEPLLKIFREDPGAWEDWYENEKELYDSLRGEYVVRELIAYGAHGSGKILEDFYRKYGKIVVDNVDYTDHFWEALIDYRYNMNGDIAKFLKVVYPLIKKNNVYFITDTEDWETFFKLWKNSGNLDNYTQEDILKFAQEAKLGSGSIDEIKALPEFNQLKKD
jgi:hypothetical protein